MNLNFIMDPIYKFDIVNVVILFYKLSQTEDGLTQDKTINAFILGWME